MEETTDGGNKQKLKFDDSEYFLDDLPKATSNGSENSRCSNKDV